MPHLQLAIADFETLSHLAELWNRASLANHLLHIYRAVMAMPSRNLAPHLAKPTNQHHANAWNEHTHWASRCEAPRCMTPLSFATLWQAWRRTATRASLTKGMSDACNAGQGPSSTHD
jgi:hypothetical protein